MDRRDVQAARDKAAEFVALSDEMLKIRERRYDVEKGAFGPSVPWQETAWIAGRITGQHRRLSLDLSRALSHMRRRR